MQNKLHLLATLAAIVVATTLFFEWRAERRDRAALQATLATAEQSLQRASASQQDRDKQLSDAVAKMASLKATVRTQQQILSRLPDVLPLPTPLKSANSVPEPQNEQSRNSSTADKLESPTPQAGTQPTAIPPEDLKPLYDFAVDCRACQAKLATATADLADEKSKTQALGRERDAALKLAKGGSLRQRFSRAVKWFVIGAAIGIAASKR